MGGSVGVNLPDTLFSNDEEGEEPRTGTRPKTNTRTPEMQRLIAEGERKEARRKARPKTMAAAVFNRALVEVDAMSTSGDWSKATARHLVALYDRLHERVYGVEAEELSASARYQAALLAGQMVKQKFDGDIGACVAYMDWAWSREREREKWRRENGREGSRIGIRLMFGGSLLTDYRLSLARKGDRF